MRKARRLFVSMSMEAGSRQLRRLHSVVQQCDTEQCSLLAQPGDRGVAVGGPSPARGRFSLCGWASGRRTTLTGGERFEVELGLLVKAHRSSCVLLRSLGGGFVRAGYHFLRVFRGRVSNLFLATTQRKGSQGTTCFGRCAHIMVQDVGASSLRA